MGYSQAPGGFLSYAKVLKRELEKLPEDPLILEYGPGMSTNLMLNVRPRAKIWTYEHDLRWATTAAHNFKGIPNIQLFHIKLEEGYDTHALGLGVLFDLVFIDGRNRVKCCHTAREVVKPGGVVVLHDSNREEYKPGLDLFRQVRYESDTSVMKLK